MEEPTDLELVALLGSADRLERERAFETLFLRHRRTAMDLAVRVLGDRALAADAVQEAFLSVYRKGARFQARARFTSWLYRVVFNRCIDLRRRERRHRSAPLLGGADSADDDIRGVPEPVSGAPGPFDALEGTERAELVREAVTRLSPKLAEVIALRYPRGMSYDEISEVLEVPPGTVKSRLSRAHAALREVLGDALDDPDG